VKTDDVFCALERQKEAQVAEYYMLRFRKDDRLLYAVRESCYQTRSASLWYTSQIRSHAYKFKSLVVIHHVLRGVKVFRDLMAARATWEIVNSTGGMVEVGVKTQADACALLEQEES